jgi:hypothetical protein
MSNFDNFIAGNPVAQVCLPYLHCQALLLLRGQQFCVSVVRVGIVFMKDKAKLITHILFYDLGNDLNFAGTAPLGP